IRPDKFRVFHPPGSTRPAPPEPNWPNEVIKRGYALAEFDRREIARDSKEAGGPLYDVMPEITGDCGALCAWAWGFSRVIDGLVQLDSIDPRKIVITGHSRSGKVALLAGALDERVAITAPAGSGCGCAGWLPLPYGDCG